MRRIVAWSAFALLAVAAVALGLLAADAGQLSIDVVLVFPIVQARGVLGVGAVLCALSALISLFLAFFEVSPGNGTEMKGSAGGVFLIGPLPIVLGTDRRMAVVAMAIAIVVLAVLLLLVLL